MVTRTFAPALMLGTEPLTVNVPHPPLASAPLPHGVAPATQLGEEKYSTVAMLVSRRRSDMATFVARADSCSWADPVLVMEAVHWRVLAGEFVHAPAATLPVPPVWLKLIELVSQATKEVEQRESVAGLQASE